VFIGVLAALGIGWTWFVWVFTFLTSYMWVVRLRQLGEHAVVPDLYDPDVRANTRTVEAPIWQRFLVAPNNVNYHLEHHFMAGVPCYNLPKLRSLLKGQGLLDNVPSVAGYGQVLKMAVLR
jgi:fatty acid desaturase